MEMEAGATAMTFTGTISYMSPERLRNLPYGYESDIWSFGITLLRLCNFKYCKGRTVDQQFFGTEISYWDIVESIINGKRLANFIKEATNG